MDKIPSIVLTKIYWYRWYVIQKELCKEYHKRTIIHEEDRNRTDIYIKMEDVYGKPMQYFNWRSNISSQGYKYLTYTPKVNKIYEHIVKPIKQLNIKLPKNYIYSNGISNFKYTNEKYGYKWITKAFWFEKV